MAKSEFYFKHSFEDLQKRVHQNAKAKGFHDNPRTEGDDIALIHSELSEALEGIRCGNPPDDKIPEFTSAEAEYADAIIRIMDTAELRGYRVSDAVVAKIEMNESRERMHGGKKF